MQTREQAECLKTLRMQGYKWNIANEVGHNLELHNVVTVNGHEYVLFVAELDAYGNVQF